MVELKESIIISDEMNQEKKQLKELQLKNWLLVLVKLDCCRVVYQSVEATNEVLEVTVTDGKLKNIFRVLHECY